MFKSILFTKIVKYFSYTSFASLFLLLIVLFSYFFNSQKLELGFFVIIFLTILNLIFIYARFIEPNLLIVKQTNINIGLNFNVALLSDLHIGTFKSSKYLARVVKKVNSLKDIDAVFIMGDILFFPDKDIDTLLSPLKALKHKTFFIYGNHDCDYASCGQRTNLKAFLNSIDINILHNSSYTLKNTDFDIIGLGDFRQKEDDFSALDKAKNKKFIVLSHNPDSVMSYTNRIPNLTISGHTHAGQIFLPFLRKYYVPSKFGFIDGLNYVYKLNNKNIISKNQLKNNSKEIKVFVSSGLGESVLPIRFGIPPRIDILNL